MIFSVPVRTPRVRYRTRTGTYCLTSCLPGCSLRSVLRLCVLPHNPDLTPQTNLKYSFEYVRTYCTPEYTYCTRVYLTVGADTPLRYCNWYPVPIIENVFHHALASRNLCTGRNRPIRRNSRTEGGVFLNSLFCCKSELSSTPNRCPSATPGYAALFIAYVLDFRFRCYHT
jgi:hypothetical protein